MIRIARRFSRGAFAGSALLAVEASAALAIPVPMVEAPLAGQPPFRRLFLDATVVERSAGLQRVFHAARKHRANPIITKEHPWEGWGPYLYGTVLHDGGGFRMWYQSIGVSGASVLNAVSDDGVRWRKPRLGLVSFDGSKDNNIVLAENGHIASVIRTAGETPGWRMLTFGGELGPRILTSSDGLHWAGASGGERLFPSSDVLNAFYDPYQRRFVATRKVASRRHRAVGIATSADGIAWETPTNAAVLTADDLDPDATQIYGMPVFPYQGMYIGLPWIYHARYIKYGKYSPERMLEAQEGSDRTVDVQLAWSWDLQNWTRPPARGAFIPLGPSGAWDSGQIYTARAPVRVGEQLFFYYGGFDRIHDAGKARAAIGLATLRLDGFCSLQAGGTEGWLITRREVFSAPRVRVNARTDPEGYIVAEILDRSDGVVPGFGRDDCIPFRGDSTEGLLQWRTAAFPPGEPDRDHKIRFFVKDADLYSYLPEGVNLSRDDGFPDP